MYIEIKEYKNYKVLCEESGQPVRTGKSKQLHIKEIERLYEIEKVGNKIIVLTKKKDPLPKLDERINNGANKYIDDIMPLLESYISAKKKDIYTTSSRLLVSD